MAEKIIMEYLLSEYGLAGLALGLIIFLVKNPNTWKFMKKYYIKIFNPQNDLRNHPLFANSYLTDIKIERIDLDENKLNEILFKLLLYSKNKAVTAIAKSEINILLSSDKIHLPEKLFEQIARMRDNYSKDFKSQIVKNYGTQRKFKNLVRLSADCNYIKNGKCLKCEACHFAEKLSEREIEIRLNKIADHVLQKFHEQHQANIDVLTWSIIDINNAYKNINKRVEDYFDELYRTLSAGIRDVVIALKNINGYIGRQLQEKP